MSAGEFARPNLVRGKSEKSKINCGDDPYPNSTVQYSIHFIKECAVRLIFASLQNAQ